MSSCTIFIIEIILNSELPSRA